MAQRTQWLCGMSASTQPDAARRVERLQPGRREVVGELLDARLVTDRGNGYGADAGGSVGSSPRAPWTS